MFAFLLKPSLVNAVSDGRADRPPSWRTLLLCASCVLAISGCSGGGPSDAEIKKALKARMDATPSGIELVSVSSHGCTASAGKSVYNCMLELEIEMGGQRGKRSTSAAFEKSGDGWVVQGVLQM